MQKDVLEQLNIKPGVTEVTLVVFDVELTLTNKHSGGLDRQQFENPYIVNVRCRQEVKAFCQKLQQSGDVIMGFATHGTNLQRVVETAQAVGITQNPLLIKTGLSTKGKNRHIRQLVHDYQKLLAEYNVKIIHVILIDDDVDNYKFLIFGDDKYIRVNPRDHSNNLHVKLDVVKVKPAKLECIREGKFILRKSVFDAEIEQYVYVETPESKENFLAKLATCEEMIKLKNEAKPQPLTQFSHRKFLSKSYGSELRHSSENENDTNVDLIRFSH